VWRIFTRRKRRERRGVIRNQFDWFIKVIEEKLVKKTSRSAAQSFSEGKKGEKTLT
jgi:hypothetical protein